MSRTAEHQPGQQAAEPGTRTNWPVFIGSGVGVLGVAIWAIIAPDSAAATIGVLVGWISNWFGWFYILLTTVILVFVVFLAVSRYGKTKLGPQHSEPEFGTFSWAAMLFAAGIGTDLMFFSVAEPVTQYLNPPVGPGGTVAAARDATVWTLFHYGISGWGMYALMGMALAYFAFRMNLPLSIRSALYPIFGKRIYGPLGHGIDLAAVIGTIFGIATSLGIGVVLLNYGLTVLFGIPESLGAQIGLIAVAVLMATLSAVSGVDKGIRRLSQLNVLLAIFLAVYILFAGRTAFLLNAFVVNIGDYVKEFSGLTLETFAFSPPSEWMNTWTLFFWAWWIAWASFVGLFLARISRGRTIRQFVAGTLIIPFLYVLMWVSVFGNSAISAVRRTTGDFGQTAINEPAQGFYSLLSQYPGFLFLAGLATFVGLLFYVTSADSGALVMADLTSYRRTPRDDAASPYRIFWAVATGLLTLAMLIVGGIDALRNATIIFGLPFAFVLALVMFGLYRALKTEALREDSRKHSLPMMLSGRSTVGDNRTAGEAWRDRLNRTMSLPDRERAYAYLSDVVIPAMTDVRDELAEHDIEATVNDATSDPETPRVELEVALPDAMPFRYQVRPHEAELPPHRSRGGDDVYYRLEVHLEEGGQGYDVMDYTHGQLIDDILDHYEHHLDFVRRHGSDVM